MDTTTKKLAHRLLGGVMGKEKLRISPTLWAQARALYEKRPGIGRQQLARALKISERRASQLLFALANQDIIRGKQIDDTKPPKGKKLKIVFLCDFHLPYHDQQAVDVALDETAKFTPDIIILGGDVVDFYQISVYSKDERLFKFIEDRDYTLDFLEMLRKSFPNVVIHYLQGNHEERLERFLWDRVPEIAKLEELNITELLRLEKFNIHYHVKPLRIGNLRFLHGHEYRGCPGTINVARTIFLKALENVVFGHWHVSQTYCQPSIDDTYKGGWSVGCLCDLHPKYKPLNKWIHGLAKITIYEDNKFEIQNLKIIEGKAL